MDALRGLAILFVLMNHVNMRLFLARVPYTRGLPKQLVSSLVWNGQQGVQMFFAISGFLISSTSLRRWGTLAAVPVREFYLLRFARIAPLFLLLLAVLSALHLAHWPEFVVSAKRGGLGAALLAALTFRINVLEATRGYLPGSWDILWSLSVEETFYLFFPLACRLLGRTKLFLLVLLVFVVLGPFGRTVLTHGNEVWREYSYLGATDAIALGCLTAMLLRARNLSRGQLATAAVLGAALLGFPLCFSRTNLASRLYASGLDRTVVAVGTCLLITFFAGTRWRGPRALVPLLWIGQRSYEIYLTHIFVVVACFAGYEHWGEPVRWAWPLFPVVILLASVLGGAVARLYSEPLNLWLRRRTREGADRVGAVSEPTIAA